MNCTICGKPAQSVVTVRISGAQLDVCNDCYTKGLAKIRAQMKRVFPRLFAWGKTLATFSKGLR